jgi:hypothetical protein
MREIAQLEYAMPLISINQSESSIEYGYNPDKAWDADIMYGCVCDSAWSVGLGDSETQLPEYFGADCSLSTATVTAIDVMFIANDECICRTMSKW